MKVIILRNGQLARVRAREKARAEAILLVSATFADGKQIK